MNRRVLGLSGVLIGLMIRLVSAGEPPVVVADYGGVSAMPYFRALNLVPGRAVESDTLKPVPIPRAPKNKYEEADMLPVHSSWLTAGVEQSRAISIPGLMPVFLVGNDATSRKWLVDRRNTLHALRAIGFVVQVASGKDLKELRQLAPGITLIPASADDLAERLGVRHYPVLITATAIEQ